MERQRITAKKTSIGEILNGKFVKKQGFESSYVLTNLGRRLSRVRLLGLIVDKFISPDEKYATVTLDDGTDTIRCKSFINTKIFDSMVTGDLVDVFGKLREYNQELYIMPEILRKVNSNFETLRLLELKKMELDQRKVIKRFIELQKTVKDNDELRNVLKREFPTEDVEGIIEAQPQDEKEKTPLVEVKSKILNLLISLDRGDGADYNDILSQAGFSETDVDSAIQDLLESGICYEPKPGKIKKL